MIIFFSLCCLPPRIHVKEHKKVTCLEKATWVLLPLISWYNLI